MKLVFTLIMAASLVPPPRPAAARAHAPTDTPEVPGVAGARRARRCGCCAEPLVRIAFALSLMRLVVVPA